jgi:hypothetical protein
MISSVEHTAAALALLFLSFACAVPSAQTVHVWERQEVVLTAAQLYKNPYTDVTVWVALTGPGFKNCDREYRRPS